MKIAIIDISIGNIRSVELALHRCGADVAILRDPAGLDEVDGIVLPGVGAFRAAMECLKSGGFMDPLHSNVVERQKPFLGICIGMQLIGEGSDEGGQWTDGLGWLPGHCERLKGGQDCPVPHVGWNDVSVARFDGLFRGLPDRPHFFFDHSFAYVGANRDDTVAEVVYGAERFAAALSRNNIRAVQFHPERSQRDGAALFGNFVSFTAARTKRAVA
ncbi:MAG: imidazole glycerol phosphate synthase subunit HisH [Alphaproteobacteria bacterium]|nr:imidazole glycerol phosphate synthase subunit HisH [Alphaproteobacteria bacterium]